MSWYEPLLDRGLIPEPALRLGIRRQLAARLREQRSGGRAAWRRRHTEIIAALSTGPLAERTADANAQHYELPPAFFERVLGEHRKYSACCWTDDADSLTAAEEATLDLYLGRARLADGQRILDLGCGWGSLSLYLARRLPGSEVVAVSNSAPQVASIQERAERMGVTNLVAVRSDINDFVPEGRFDRVVSIEMFEHMANYRELLARIAAWLRPNGLLFVHHFAHARYAYRFAHENDDEWMARHFFTGGIMPTADLLQSFDEHLRVIDGWNVDGTHYQRTCEAWLQNMLRNRAGVEAALREAYGDAWRRGWHRWRVFFLACSELFGYADGREWIVAHRLLAARDDATTL